MTTVADGPMDNTPPAPPSRAMAYWMATRSYSFPASIVSIFLGVALAWRGYGLPEGQTGSFDLLAFLLTLIGGLLAHAGGNVVNDYFDYVKGVDTKPEHGSGVLPQKLLTKGEMLIFAVQLLGGAALCGILLLMRSPSLIGVVVPLALLGLFCAVAYTWFLKQIALGDLVIMTAFGLGLTLGAYGVQVPVANLGQIGLVLLLSLPLTLLVDSILHANNIRDTQTDRAAGVTTVAAVLGPQGSQVFQGILIFGPLVLAIAFTLLRILPWSALATVLALPVLQKAFKTGDVPFCAQSHMLFGLLYSIGIAAMPHP
ncbi:MAG: 1,4-dihydroxy-2-naphthoate octaprenyltransferase [Armatimonadaceae bacterium]